MRVLHLAYRDTSGVPGRWSKAHRAAGVEADLLVELPHPFSYRAREIVRRWSPEGVEGIEGWLANADAVMAYDHSLYLQAAIDTGKPVLFRALGQSSREHAGEIRELLQAPNVVRATTGTADLAQLLDIELAGAPYKLPKPADPDGSLALVHAPSDRKAKGTERVLRAAEASGWTVDLVENSSNTRVLECKRRAALVVDTCGPDTIPDGYGVNAVEGMALGLPVISSATSKVAGMLHAAGSPVLLVADENALRGELEAMKEPGIRKSRGLAGRAFVARFHSPELRAREDIVAIREIAVPA